LEKVGCDHIKAIS
jgi:hypothetical protein